jgi:hypothetical protein
MAICLRLPGAREVGPGEALRAEEAPLDQDARDVGERDAERVAQRCRGQRELAVLRINLSRHQRERVHVHRAAQQAWWTDAQTDTRS